MKSAIHDCPVCGEGSLTEGFKIHETEHSGHKLIAHLCYSSCNFCYSEITNEEQSVFNRRSVNRQKKIIDKIPSGADIRKMRKQCQLSQAEAGKLIGGGPVAFSKYESDDLIPDAAMGTLLALLVSDHSLIEKIRSIKSSNTYNSIGIFEGSLDESSWTQSSNMEGLAFDDDIFVNKKIKSSTMEVVENFDHLDWN